MIIVMQMYHSPVNPCLHSLRIPLFKGIAEEYKAGWDTFKISKQEMSSKGNQFKEGKKMARAWCKPEIWNFSWPQL
jgi:hypothetical protein